MDLKRKLALITVVLSFSLAGYPAAAGADTDAQTGRTTAVLPHAGKKVLIVSSDHAYPPYVFMKDGTPTGFNIELIRAVAEVMDIPIRIVLGPWSLVRHKLESRKVDVPAGMYYSKERDLLADFSVPNTLVTSGLFVRKGSSIRSLEGIRDHVTIYSRPGIGSIFKVFFPASTAEASQAPPITEDGDIPGGSETVLLCEDDESVRQLSMSILSSNGYHVISACSGMDALELAGRGGSIDLLLADVIMPGMNGKMLAERLKKNIPNLKIMFISGYTDDVIIHQGILEPGFELLMKPFTSADLLCSIRRVIDGAA